MSHSPGKPTLYLITYEYPFGLAETFLESEVHALAKIFDRVVVIPSRAAFSSSWIRRQRAASARKMPESFELWLPNSVSWATWLHWPVTFFRLLLASRRALPNEVNWRKLVSETLRDGVKATLFLERTRPIFAAASFRVSYTYWKGPATIAMCQRVEIGLDKIGPVTRCHRGDLYYDLPDHPARPFDPMIARLAAAVVPISQDGHRHLLEHGFDQGNLLVSRLGVTLPAGVAQASTDGVWRFVSCSNVISVKRVTLIAQALSRIAHPFHWTHFGDGIELPTVRQIAARFAHGGNATFPGRRPNAEVLSHLQTQPVDLFLNLSSSEGVPVSIMEALAAGVPCIATDVGGTSEILDESVGGLIEPDTTADQIGALISTELGNVEAWRAKRRNARLRAEALCDAVANYRDFALFLNGLMTLENGQR